MNYNLSDYIILSRSAVLLNSLPGIDDFSFHNGNDYDTVLNVDQNLENLFSMYPGYVLEKYIVIADSETMERIYRPIYLLTVPSYKDGKTLVLPMTLTKNGLYGIYTVFGYSENPEIDTHAILFDLLPITPLVSLKGPIEFGNYIKEGLFIDEMKDRIDTYFNKEGLVLDKIYSIYSKISEFNIAPVDLDSESDKYAKYINSNYILDKPEESKIKNMPITPNMFMPLAIREEAEDTSVANTNTKVKLLSLKYTSSKDSDAGSNSTILTSNVSPITSLDEINKPNESDLENSTSLNKIVVLSPNECKFVIINIASMIYLGDGILMSVIKKPVDEADKLSLTIDLNKLVLFDEDGEVENVTDSAYITSIDNVEESVSLESISTSTKNLLSKIKDGGTKFNLNVLPFLRKMVGLPKDVVNLVYKFSLKIFNCANKMEQNKALDYQEKMLNDQISEFSETMEKLLSNGLIAVGALMIPVGFLVQLIIFLIAKSVNESIRVRALERMEHRLEDIIDRLDKKIEFANQDYNKEAVNDLKKQRAMYVFAFERIAQVKKKVYHKGLKESAFKKYEKFKED